MLQQHLLKLILLPALLCNALFTAPTRAWSADAPAPPPAYNEVRYDENYTYLRDPNRRGDFFDPIKYIPLNETGDYYLSFGGETRQTYEWVKNDAWGRIPYDKDGYYLQRYMVHGDLHFNKESRLFAQLKSGIETGRLGGPRVVDEDELDVHQLFFDYNFKPGIVDSLQLRVGRQEIIFGTRRLVNYRERPNVRLSYDALKMVAKTGSWTMTGFYSKFAQTKRGVFDDGIDQRQGLWGFYTVNDNPAYLPGKIDLYYLGLERDYTLYTQGPGDELRHTVGMRLWDKPGNWDYNFEFVYQFGQITGGDIQAWAAFSDTGYTFKFDGKSLRTSLRADLTSGDKNPNNPDLNTFNPLLPKGRHLSQLAPYGPMNVRELHPHLDFKPVSNLTISPMWSFLWRDSIRDGIYNIAMLPVRNGDQSRARYLGSMPGVETVWQVDRHLSFNMYYNYFFAGGFIKETQGKDINYASAFMTYMF